MKPARVIVDRDIKPANVRRRAIVVDVDYAPVDGAREELVDVIVELLDERRGKRR